MTAEAQSSERENKLNAAVDQLSARILEHEQRHDQVNNEKLELVANNERLQVQLADQQVQLQAKIQTIDQLRTDLTGFEAQLAAKELEIQALKSQYEESQDLKNSVLDKDKQIESAETNVLQLNEVIASLRSEIEQHEVKALGAEEQKTKLASDVEQLNQRVLDQ